MTLLARILPILLLTATPAIADDVMALAYAHGRAAIGVARPDSAAAVAAARAQCGSECRILAVAPAGTCLALAREQGPAFGWALEPAEQPARDAAIDACRDGNRGRSCAVVAARCLPAARAPAHYGSPSPLRIADPSGTIVIIHMHGSRQPDEPDPCEMNQINAEFGVPSVIHALDGTVIAGRRVVVDGFCPPSRVGVLDPQIGQLSKLGTRALELGRRAAAYVAAGVPPRQIILSGHSSGGWAALMVERERADVIGGVIAFAPAAFGMAANRPPLTAQVRRTRYGELRSAPRLRALIFGFAGDDFESADDLRVFARTPGVSFVAIPEPGPAGRRCALPAHSRVRDPCFSETQGQRIRAFIAARVAGAGS
jgi:hypothetical protein